MSIPTPPFEVHILSYGAGNILSLYNSLKSLPFPLKLTFITTPEEFRTLNIKLLIFPGVGSFGSAMASLERMGVVSALKEYVLSGKPYLGICLGMQVLFESSSESPGVKGLGVIPGVVGLFDNSNKRVPHIGWNGLHLHQSNSSLFSSEEQANVDTLMYFVHSFAVPILPMNVKYMLTSTDYEDETFISSVAMGNLAGCQFHPEKSGRRGVDGLERFIKSIMEMQISASAGGEEVVYTPLYECVSSVTETETADASDDSAKTKLSKRLIAALDVRENDQGEIIVTKGDQYNVRPVSQASSSTNGGEEDVRNLGQPILMARKYYEDGIDELCFLNITSYRFSPVSNPTLQNLIKTASSTLFIPLTIGGGVRNFYDDASDKSKCTCTALQVADSYFSSGADKVSVGSDAVTSVEQLRGVLGGVKDGKSSIETINLKYGAQACVVSVDPKRVYVTSNEQEQEFVKLGFTIVDTKKGKCIWQCTIKGGRETRPLDALQLCTSVEYLGAGEIMLNSIDSDGTNSGYDIDLMQLITSNVTIPVIASSGAGCVNDVVDVFKKVEGLSAALAAGIFHRGEVEVGEVKKGMVVGGVRARIEV